ncbi:hypothetical protein EI555_003741 [Monodon monoceros]|uniref:Uncharacterized protein n=1 Tax=Monodon monoceros TaxID=40151 RepID=A0A4V6WP39_MONMO|nr:hypothetical protein EI555_003741 [Monodon monoceros]
MSPQVVSRVGGSSAGPPPAHVSQGSLARGGDPDQGRLALTKGCENRQGLRVQLEGLSAALSHAQLGREAQASSKTPPGRARCGRGRRTGAPTSPCSLISPSFRCLEPPHLANLTLENASECLMQH